jgi:hypothetical protein
MAKIKNPSQPKSQLIYSSLAGEFAVLSQLNLHQFDASLTLANTKGVDILVSNPRTGSIKRIEVKTKIAKSPIHRRIFSEEPFVAEWQMGQKHETIKDDNLLYCFVHFSSKETPPEFFIVPSSIVAAYVRLEHVHWRKTPGKKKKKHGITDMRMFRIGISGKYKPGATPLCEEYKNRWDFIFPEDRQLD